MYTNEHTLQIKSSTIFFVEGPLIKLGTCTTLAVLFFFPFQTEHITSGHLVHHRNGTGQY